MDMDILYRQDDHKMVGSKKNIIFLHDEKGNSFLSCCLLLRKLCKMKVFILWIALFDLKKNMAAGLHF